MYSEFYAHSHLTIGLVVIDDVMVCSMFICPQNCLNVSYVKTVPASEIIVLGSPDSMRFLVAFTRSYIPRLSASYYSCKLAAVIYHAQKSFIYNKRYQCQPPPTACMVPHMGFPSLVVVFADVPGIWHTALWCSQYLYSYSPCTQTSWLKVSCFSKPIWLQCNCSRKGIIILLPFMAMPSIITSSCLLGI